MANSPGWNEAWNKPASELTEEEDRALREHCQQQLWDARLSRYMAAHRSQEGVFVSPATEKPEEDYAPWWVTLLLFIGPFIFLAALALILCIFCGARLN
jgi:hypothetical protein